MNVDLVGNELSNAQYFGFNSRFQYKDIFNEWSLNIQKWVSPLNFLLTFCPRCGSH